MGFPTMWYVRPAMPQISLRICAVWSEPFRASINFQIQEVQTSYPWNLEVPLIFFGSPTFFCDTVAVWRIVKLALNKIYISEIILCSLQDG